MFQFTGKCVGGIADGREYRHHLPEMVVEQRKKVDGVEVKTGERTEYKFLLLLGSLRGDLGVWVPVGTELDAVVMRLLACYKPHLQNMILPSIN